MAGPPLIRVSLFARAMVLRAWGGGGRGGWGGGREGKREGGREEASPDVKGHCRLVERPG
jgi:hypothetical protein